MFTRSRRIRFKLRAALQNVLHLALTAFPADIPIWSSENLIGLPPFQGLLTGLSQVPSETISGDVLSEVEEPHRGEPKRAVAAVVVLDDVEVVRCLAVLEMSERYRLAKGQTMLLSKKAQN